MPSPRIVSAPSPGASSPENPDWSACAQSSLGGSSTPPMCEHTQPSVSQESLDPKSSGGPCRINCISSSQQGSKGLRQLCLVQTEGKAPVSREKTSMAQGLCSAGLRTYVGREKLMAGREDHGRPCFFQGDDVRPQSPLLPCNSGITQLEKEPQKDLFSPS